MGYRNRPSEAGVISTSRGTSDRRHRQGGTNSVYGLGCLPAPAGQTLTFFVHVTGTKGTKKGSGPKTGAMVVSFFSYAGIIQIRSEGMFSGLF